MLSKSQARWFFWGGTAFSLLSFVFLTVDPLREIPARQNADALTESVVRGKMIWDSENCVGCHTILGEGFATRHSSSPRSRPSGGCACS